MADPTKKPTSGAAPQAKPTMEQRLAAAAADRQKQVEHLAGMLTGLTLAVSIRSGIPEVAVEVDESAQVVEAFLTMSEEFGWEPDPRVTASINFISVLGSVAAGRVLAYKARMAAEEEPQLP